MSLQNARSYVHILRKLPEVSQSISCLLFSLHHHSHLAIRNHGKQLPIDGGALECLFCIVLKIKGWDQEPTQAPTNDLEKYCDGVGIFVQRPPPGCSTSQIKPGDRGRRCGHEKTPAVYSSLVEGGLQKQWQHCG